MESPLQIASVKDVCDWGWDGPQLMEVLDRLDHQTLDGLTHAHAGNPQQWASVLMQYPETWRLFVDRPGSVVGYWHFVPLHPDDYAKAKAGLLLDSEIRADRLEFFEPPVFYNMYFVQVCLDARHRTLDNIRLLFGSTFTVLEELAMKEVFVREITANAYTQVGEGLCRSFGMKPLCRHVDRGRIYSARIEDVFRHPLAEQFPEMTRRYREGLAAENLGRERRRPMTEMEIAQWRGEG